MYLPMIKIKTMSAYQYSLPTDADYNQQQERKIKKSMFLISYVVIKN